MKGNPNDEQIGFVAKVWDETTGTFRPIYTLPDATDEVKGGVYLTDSIDDLEYDSAANSVTAVSAKAVKEFSDDKVSKTDPEDQSIKSNLLPDTNGEQNLGDEEHSWNIVYGAATSLNVGTVGSTKEPVYFLDGVPTVCDSVTLPRASRIEILNSFNQYVKPYVPNILAGGFGGGKVDFATSSELEAGFETYVVPYLSIGGDD